MASEEMSARLPHGSHQGAAPPSSEFLDSMRRVLGDDVLALDEDGRTTEGTAVAALAGMAADLDSERRRLAELDRIKSHFLNLAAHELRGPLAVARGYVAMLAEGDFGPIDRADLTAALPVLQGKLSEMGALVDRMLETARLEDGKLHLAVSRVELRLVVHEALRIMVPLAVGHRLLVNWTGADVVVEADRGRLVTIMTNLLDNACKYSDPGTAIEIRFRSGDGRVHVEVHDQGFGIAAADVASMFTKFGRILTPRNSHVPGSGLGLHLCRELARMHGGDLTLARSSEAGSVFRLTLPTVPGRAVPQPRTSAGTDSAEGP